MFCPLSPAELGIDVVAFYAIGESIGTSIGNFMGGGGSRSLSYSHSGSPRVTLIASRMRYIGLNSKSAPVVLHTYFLASFFSLMKCSPL